MHDRRFRVAPLALLSVLVGGLLGRADAAPPGVCATAITPRPAPLPVSEEVLRASRPLVLQLGSFEINIIAGTTLQANAPALAAFHRAADQWTASISDPIVVNINADLANLGSSSIIGQSSAVPLIASYATIRNAVVADGGADSGDAITASIPTAMTFLYPPTYGPTGNLVATKANMKALGFTGLDASFGASDASITFNTQFAFDFDNSDGVSPGTMDFETAAAHEIGHALGFISSVDDVDTGPAGNYPATPLDLYRFQYGTANDPATVADFGSFPRSQQPGVEAVFDDIDAERRMSTGEVNGDGRQASHWKDDALTGVFIGIMDPTLPAGTVETVGPADLRAIDLIGYDIASLGTTTTSTTTASTTSTTTTTVPPLCGPAPATGCLPSGAANLTIRDDADPARHQLKWGWSRGAQTDVGDFKDPVHGSASYALCVYDASGSVQPLMASHLLPGGTCGAHPCWKAAGAIGFVYANRLGTPEGIVKAKLRAGSVGRAQITIQARGANLAPPAPPLTLPVTAQLVIADSGGTTCWEAVYAVAPANVAGRFKAKAP